MSSTTAIIFSLAMCHMGHAWPWIARSPSDGIFFVRNTITLICQIKDLEDGSMYWAKGPDYSTSVCTGSNYQGLCEKGYPRLSMTVDRNTNMYNLVITNSQLEDGGGYQCYPDNAFDQHSHIAVIIVADIPTIDVPKSIALDTDFPISVSSTFQSVPYVQLLLLPDLKPVAYLRVRPNFLVSSSVDYVSDQTTNKVTMNLKGIVKLAYEDLPAVIEYSFDIKQPPESIITEQRLNVEYGPRNVQIKPRRVADAYYYEDTTLTCSATGNPTPTLTFTAVEFFSNKAVSDSLPTNVKGNISITLNKKWIGEMYLLKCTAVNSPITAQGKREPVTVSTDVKFTVVSNDAATQALSLSTGTRLALALTTAIIGLMI